MKINAEGQVTIPQEIRERYGLTPGTEVELDAVGDEIRIRRALRGDTLSNDAVGGGQLSLPTAPYPGKGAALVALTLGQRTTGLTPEEVEEIYREED